MSLEALTPNNTTVIMIDFAIGFANVIRSHDLTTHQNNVLLLAKTALNYGSGLVVTNGPAHKTSGPLYPKLTEVLGDHPLVVRGGMFNAFLFPGFAEAVAATERKNLVVAGLITEGCVLQTVLGGVRAGYNVYVAVDTCGGQSKEAHDAAIQRMIGAGVVPVTSFALASEFQVDQARPDGSKFFGLTAEFNPELTFQAELYQAAQQDVRQEASS